MANYKDIASFFEEKGPEDIERFVDKNLDISQQVHAILEEKGWTQGQFAEKLGKTDAEVSKWLSGMHNLTLKSIAKMEAVLGTDIILTPQKAKEKYTGIQHFTILEHVKIKRLTTENEAGALPPHFSLYSKLETNSFYSTKIAGKLETAS
ncbi:MAG: hypothetical protein RI973_2328 [Bacteroidota bacterium]|jgi:transcriptional regulator with XRE-family HTH domain